MAESVAELKHWVLPASFDVCEYKRLGGNLCPIPSPQHDTKGFERGSILRGQ